MGGLCCHKGVQPTLEPDEECEILPRKTRVSMPTERLLRIEVTPDALLMVSYAQRRFRGFKKVWQFDQKRLLLVTSPQLIALELLNPASHVYRLVAWQGLPPSSKYLFGSFVDDNQSDYLLGVVSANDKLLLRTLKIARSRQRAEPSLDSPSTRAPKWHVMEKKSMEVRVPLEGEENCFTNVVLLDTNQNEESPLSPLRTVPERAKYFYDMLPCEEREVNLPPTKAPPYIRIINNMPNSHAEVVIVSGGGLFVATVKHQNILATTQIQLGFNVVAVEHWGGYYFTLCEDGNFKILKRALDSTFQEVKSVALALPEFAGSFKLTHMKTPTLDWPERLVNALQKELPRYMLFGGSLTGKEKDYKCLLKYDLHEGKYSHFAAIDSDAAVTCINYGPYDNGPVMVGLNNGVVMAFDFYSLEKLQQLKSPEQEEIRCITYEPCKTVIVGTTSSVLLYTLTHELFLYSYLESPGNGVQIKVQRKK